MLNIRLNLGRMVENTVKLLVIYGRAIILIIKSDTITLALKMLSLQPLKKDNYGTCINIQ